jgi:hypothetical protein
MLILSLEEVGYGATAGNKMRAIQTTSYLKNNPVHWLKNKVKSAVNVKEVKFFPALSYNRIK